MFYEFLQLGTKENYLIEWRKERRWKVTRVAPSEESARPSLGQKGSLCTSMFAQN